MHAARSFRRLVLSRYIKNATVHKRLKSRRCLLRLSKKRTAGRMGNIMCKTLFTRAIKPFQTFDNWVRDVVYGALGLTYAPPEPEHPPIDTTQECRILWYDSDRNMHQQVRRWRIQRNGGRYTRREWATLLARYEYRCLRCGSGDDITADHVVPVAYGGHSNIDNIQPLCRSCNSWKGIQYIDYRTDYRATA